MRHYNGFILGFHYHYEIKKILKVSKKDIRLDLSATKKAEQYIGIIRLFCSNQTPGSFRLFVNILFNQLIHIVCILYLLFCKNFFASSAKSAVTFLIFSSVIAFHPLCFGFISYSTDL